MTNKAYNIFCIVVGVLTCFALYKLFVEYNVGGMFVDPPVQTDGKVSVAALQTNDILAGVFELVLSVLIALGGTVISIATGGLKSLGELLGLSHYWEDEPVNTTIELSTISDSRSALEETLLIAVKAKNEVLTAAVCEELAGERYLSKDKDV